VQEPLARALAQWQFLDRQVVLYLAQVRFSCEVSLGNRGRLLVAPTTPKQLFANRQICTAHF